MFEDRADAGRMLVGKLSSFKGDFEVVVAIPRGGVVVGSEISGLLRLPLAPLVVKKTPTFCEPELAAGAVGPNGFSIGKRSRKIERIVEKRIKMYGRPGNFEGKKILLVDDGVATGATIETAIYFLQKRNVSGITVAVPVVSKSEFERLQRLVRRVVALKTPDEFRAIDEFYRNFSQITDDEVIQLLHRQNETNNRFR